MQSYIFAKEQYLTAVESWKSKASHTVEEHIAYNVIRGFEPTRGFTPIQGCSKINSNSCDAWYGFNRPLRNLKGWLNNTSVWQAERNAKRCAELEASLGIKLTEEFKAAILAIPESK